MSKRGHKHGWLRGCKGGFYCVTCGALWETPEPTKVLARVMAGEDVPITRIVTKAEGRRLEAC